MNQMLLISSSFQAKLLLTAPILVPDDYNDVDALMRDSPNLIHSIVYVASRFIPGYQELRESLASSIASFLRGSWITSFQSSEEQASNMHALLILYIFSRSGAVERSCGSEVIQSGVNFWSIKLACEAYAVHIGLHRTVDAIHAAWRSSTVLGRTDVRVRLYLYWLWLFATSHQYDTSCLNPQAVLR
jgi:hypothetical protein